ncbi:MULTISPECIES: hypothetical protein [unclassified Streptomyces]|uniref:hypothetical protein n=1 Tax=unclassified Streptomyces TaxID=2593676 RepID=UPI0006F8200C|nr:MULTISPECIES: hypothetical protein [unclassified Streptomyces]KQX45643.1 hypothetical protein ASD33_24755 [Streptomyces sp. Root1304]KRA79587.1 hypothetical protein ASE09_20275 [Streptomyces sp. Root66D1]
MPRGRHRHSPPLHKLLPPSAVAGAAVVCAAAAWLPGDQVVARLLAAAAAAAAVTGAVLMRSWDRSAGLRVAELDRARTADQWKAEERVAELESDLDESRALRSRLDAKLRAKRVELAALRGEHADLLRRYATAETERASALEGARVLALETASVSSSARALPAGGTTTTPEAFRRAAQALRDLPRSAAAQHARRTTEAARARDLAERARETEEPQGKHAAAAGTEHSRPAAPALALPPAAPVPPASAMVPAVPTATAIVPYAARRPVPRPEGGFDFFGTQKAAAAIEAVQHTDLADVVGEEVLEEALAAQAVLGAPLLTPVSPSGTPLAPRVTPSRAVGQVIDLTAHDETEQLDVAELRGAVNS